MRDTAISQMREELVELRGPLPSDEADDAASVVSVGSMASSAVAATAASSRALLHIWIPSVFLSGGGTGKTHHVYQVYLRIRDEEWNIYRRYSDFYALHAELRRQEATLDTFDFPPKKTVGYKAEKVVEDRRRRLQSYLRKIANLLLQTNPALAARPTKDNVLLLMPFFAEGTASYAQQQQRKKAAARGRSRSQGRTLFGRRSSGLSSTPQLAL